MMFRVAAKVATTSLLGPACSGLLQTMQQQQSLTNNNSSNWVNLMCWGFVLWRALPALHRNLCASVLRSASSETYVLILILSCNSVRTTSLNISVFVRARGTVLFNILKYQNVIFSFGCV